MAIIAPHKIFGLRITGIRRVQSRINQVRASIARTRHVGVPKVGRYLLKKKKLDCKMGLYGGQEVAPNKWRYGWETLGGPAKNYFTKATLNAHEVSGSRFSKGGDSIFVSINLSKAPHARLIHGPIDRLSSYFYNKRLKAQVRQRPWMAATRTEKEACVGIIAGTYGGPRAAAIAGRQRLAILMGSD